MAQEKTTEQHSPVMVTMDFKVTGMHCDACVNRVQQHLKNLRGVETAEVDLAGERAQVRFQPSKVSTSGIVAAIVAAGYQAEPL